MKCRITFTRPSSGNPPKLRQHLRLAKSPWTKFTQPEDVSKAYLIPAVRRTVALLELAGHICDKAREYGVEKLIIDVRADSPAYRTWLRMGFTTFGTLDDYARTAGVSHRGHYMEHSPTALRSVVDAALAARGVA